MSEELFLRRVRLLKQLGWLALAGALLLAVGLSLSRLSAGPQVWMIAGLLMVVPAAFYLVLLTLWHWKSRYIGSHSDLWGGVLVIESSGWFKLVYLFRHIIPDARGTGRYRRGRSTASA